MQNAPTGHSGSRSPWRPQTDCWIGTTAQTPWQCVDVLRAVGLFAGCGYWSARPIQPELEIHRAQSGSIEERARHRECFQGQWPKSPQLEFLEHINCGAWGWQAESSDAAPFCNLHQLSFVSVVSALEVTELLGLSDS